MSALGFLEAKADEIIQINLCLCCSCIDYIKNYNPMEQKKRRDADGRDR